MKRIFYSFLAFALPISAFAQIPVIDSAESYYVGQHFHYMLCSPAAAGDSGAMQSWDFTSISDSTIVPVDVFSSVAYPGYDSVSMGGGTSYVVNVNNSQTTMKEADAQIAVVTYSPVILLAPHPVTYSDTASGSFTDVSTAPSTGGGTWNLKADGYGSLKTPQATFDNTLRIRTYRSEDDTIALFGSEHVDFISYMWYDSTHSFPLMRIDSVIATGLFPVTNITVAYYTTDTPTAVRNINRSEANAAAHFDNNGLVLKTALVQGHQYKLGLLNLNGQIVYATTFTASGGELERFNITNQMPAGTYFLSVSEMNTVKAPLSIKVLKQ